MDKHTLVIAFFILINIVFFLKMFIVKKTFFNSIETEFEEIVYKLKHSPYDEKASRALRNFCNDLFYKSTTLYIIWKKYEQHLVILDEIADSQHYSGSEPENYFNLENILNTTKSNFISIPLWSATPQALTSVGIIGTFSSIFMVLFFNSGEINEIFINRLVHAVATGFLSSIIGVGLAVFFLMYEKYRSNLISNNAENINLILADFFPILTTDGLLQKQIVCLQKLSSEINTSISTGFSEMTGNMGNAMIDIMDDDTKKIVKENIAKSFIEMNNILSAVHAEAKELFTEIQELRKSKIEIIESINSIRIEQTNLQLDINKQTASLSENLATLEKTLAPLREVASQVQATNELSSKLVNSVTEVGNASKIVQEIVAHSSTIITEFKPQMKQLSEEYKGLSMNIESWVKQSNISVQNNLKEFDTHIATVLERATSLSNGLNTSVTRLDTTFQNFTEKVNMNK
jgi:hypothetical protein